MRQEQLTGGTTPDRFPVFPGRANDVVISTSVTSINEACTVPTTDPEATQREAYASPPAVLDLCLICACGSAQENLPSRPFRKSVRRAQTAAFPRNLFDEAGPEIARIPAHGVSFRSSM